MIAWVDVETTGLDERRDALLEVALVFTDDDLVELCSTSVVLKHPGPAFVDGMHPKVVEMHTKNGLWQACAAPDAVTKGRAAAVLLECCMRGTALGGLPAMASNPLRDVPLAGSTVGFDRRFLREHLPTVEEMFSYESIDVSSFTEIAKRWAPSVYDGRPKADPDKIAHRALADVRESIAVLRYYRDHMLGFAELVGKYGEVVEDIVELVTAVDDAETAATGAQTGDASEVTG